MDHVREGARVRITAADDTGMAGMTGTVDRVDEALVFVDLDADKIIGAVPFTAAAVEPV